MPSRSLIHWERTRLASLNQLETIRTGGRRIGIRQVDQAYAVLLSSHFQAFCRDLHSEAVASICSVVSPTDLQTVVRLRLTEGRKLDQGNPTPGHLGADFGRLGFKFWDEVKNMDRRNEHRQATLSNLNEWRNAIAHQDFDPTKLGRTTLRLADVRRWREACKGLARAFDHVVAERVAVLAGSRPW